MEFRRDILTKGQTDENTQFQGNPTNMGSNQKERHCKVTEESDDTPCSMHVLGFPGGDGGRMKARERKWLNSQVQNNGLE